MKTPVALPFKVVTLNRRLASPAPGKEAIELVTVQIAMLKGKSTADFGQNSNAAVTLKDIPADKLAGLDLGDNLTITLSPTPPAPPAPPAPPVPPVPPAPTE